MARTVADAQDVGKELGSAGVSIARGALRLAYDVGAVVGLAARGLVSATLDAADTVAPRALKTAAGSSGALVLRKPPVAVDSARREGRSARRLAG
jgi:glycine/serine hydroxymethyltransferase